MMRVTLGNKSRIFFSIDGGEANNITKRLYIYVQGVSLRITASDDGDASRDE